MDEGISAIPGTWRFDDEVATSFETHVRKSIPFYEEIQRMVVELSEYFVRDGAVVYDLGSSTGETLDRLVSAHRAKERMRFIGIDASSSMVRKARERVPDPSVRFLHQNILDLEFSPPPNLITSLFTLQFLTLADRRELLERAWEEMIEGGGLIIVEKTRADDTACEDIWTELYWDFKRRRGLTPDQILDKANSIRGVLNPLSTKQNLALLEQTGFSSPEIFFKWYNWIGLLAIKGLRPTGPQGGERPEGCDPASPEPP